MSETSSPAAKGGNFLNHVAGLRGIAILMIVLFHLCRGWCRSGHFGVDAFLVISGFFLLPGLYRKMEQGQFAFSKFYAGKIGRIFPVLLLLVLLTLALVVSIFDAQQIRLTAEAGLSALLGLSNVYLDEYTGGYFAASRGLSSRMFMHTWYLSVTLQLYLLLPLAVWVLRKLPKLVSRVLCTAVFIISFCAYYHDCAITDACCPAPFVWLTSTVCHGLASIFGDSVFVTESSSYYWTIGRLWEVMLGGVILWLPECKRPAWNTVLSVVGLLAILLSGFAFPKQSMFNLPTVLGTMLVIRYAGTGVMCKALANPVFLWVGKISFSLYLMHWLVLMVAESVTTQRMKAGSFLLMIAVSLLLAWGVYHLVEKRRFKLWQVLTAWAALAAGAGALIATDGLRQQLRKEANDSIFVKNGHSCEALAESVSLAKDWPVSINQDSSIMNGWFGDGVKAEPGSSTEEAELVHVGTTERPSEFVMLGDSFCNATFPVLHEAGQRYGWSGTFARAYIVPLTNYYYKAPFARHHYVFAREGHAALLGWLEKHPELHTVILVQNWTCRIDDNKTWDGEPVTKQQLADGMFEQMMRGFITQVHNMGKQVILLMPPPEIQLGKEAPASYLFRQRMLGRDLNRDNNITDTLTDYTVRHALISGIMKRMEAEGLCRVLHVEKGYFDGENFCALSKDNHILMADATHPSFDGAMLGVEAIHEQLTELLKQKREEK